ncbi:hypothetical protein PoB_006681700 [Plakobranchus ocellatus]|uniref:Uncharacterized protein n=1 Tax=Plakobranchus ocellatus TaxID=259542 RepID=A0AAV4D886_9GAST|nr:hypothetical protein PoB_006681700 [Plakobranchus ocellatus]
MERRERKIVTRRMRMRSERKREKDVGRKEKGEEEVEEVRGVGGTVASESALKSAGILLLRVRATPPASWLTEGPKP